MAEQSVGQVTYSDYYYRLEEAAKIRYKEKLAILGGINDLYLTMENNLDCLEWQDWPEVQYPDIYNYLITTPSPHTKEEMKAYKSLEGYRQFVDGWVSNVKVCTISYSNSYLIMASVKHSQRLSLSPVKAIGSEKKGVVLCAHCNCMAGLGEACSHITAILFTLEGAVAHRDYFFLNQHNFLITTVITLFFIYLRTELNYLSNDIIICGFVVVVYTLYRWTSQI